MQNSTRLDLSLIKESIEPGARVLDLGCGSGELLYDLFTEKQVQGHGVEIQVELITACVEKGVPVIHADLDEGLGDYPDQSFDYVVLSHTLQTVHHPHFILKEMLRVGRTGFVSVPNFGYWRVRSQLFFKGYMPKTKTLPFEWFNTPNIHLLTIRDFLRFCQKENIAILDRYYFARNRRIGLPRSWLANFFAETVVFVIQRGVDDETLEAATTEPVVSGGAQDDNQNGNK